VLFGETLLASLEPDELAAIFAHEVAHLEYFDRQRLRRLTLFVWATIGLAVLVVPLTLAWFPKNAGTVIWVFPFALLWTLLPVLARRKAREAESDRRAAILCGDAEALVRALTKLHTLAQVPRRWSLEAERAATHPSLAHRIQAIRAATESAPRTLDKPIIVGSCPPGTFVVFETDRISWLEGVPCEVPVALEALREAAAAVRAVRYAELLELRMAPALAGSASLVTTDRKRHTWSVVLQSQDVAAVQSALDAVDARLAPAVADSGQHPWASTGVARAPLMFCRDVWRNILAGLRITAMRQVDLAVFRSSADHLVVLVALNLVLLLAVSGAPRELWAYWVLYHVSTSLWWITLLLFAGYLVARFEGERITALALPVVLLCIYPVFFGFSALWKLADAFKLLQGRAGFRLGLWYAYYGWLALAGLFALRTVVGRWSRRLPVYAVLLLSLFSVPTWYLSNHGWGEEDPEEDQEQTHERLPSPAREEVLQIQPQLLRRELAALKPQRPGVVDLYFVGFGGYATQDVFMKEVESIRKLFDDRFDTGGRSLALINNPKTMKQLPFATASNLEAALRRIGRVMNPEEDMLFLYLTSHGSASQGLSVTFWPLELQQIEPQRLRQMIDRAGIKWRVIVISACYSGGFIDALKNDHTLIATAAAADRTSFGCGNGYDFTYFGKAYFDEALRQSYSFVDAFDLAKGVIASREEAEKKTPSHPQIFVGSAVRGKLERLQRRLSAGATL
jgi:hypothetical protein